MKNFQVWNVTLRFIFINQSNLFYIHMIFFFSWDKLYEGFLVHNLWVSKLSIKTLSKAIVIDNELNIYETNRIFGVNLING